MLPISEISLVPVGVVGIRGSLSYLVWPWIEEKPRDLEPVDCEGFFFQGNSLAKSKGAFEHFHYRLCDLGQLFTYLS